MRATTPYSETANVSYVDNPISKMDSRFKCQPNLPISKTKREDVFKLANSLNILQPFSNTPNVNYVDSAISSIDSRYHTAPRVPMSTAKRDDILKLANPQRVPMPMSITSECRYVEHPISKFDSRFKRSVKTNFGKSKTTRDDVFKQRNTLEVQMPYSYTKNVAFISGDFPSYNSRFKRPTAPSISTTKREDIFKQRNSLGALLPGVSETSKFLYVENAISQYDSRFRSIPKPTFGVSKRGDILKQANPLGVALPSKNNSTQYLPQDYNDSLRKDFSKKKWTDHTMGITSRFDIWKQANKMRVSVPYSKTPTTEYLTRKKAMNTTNSKIKRTPGCTFSSTNREDVSLQNNVLGVLQLPHSKRSTREKKMKGYVKKPHVPRCRTKPSKTYFKAVKKDLKKFTSSWKSRSLCAQRDLASRQRNEDAANVK